MPKGKPIHYSADELAWLEANRLMVISDYHLAFVAAFGRDISAGSLHSLRKRKGWSTGRSGQFERGATAHNKGKPCAPGTGGRHPNSRKTQFRKGEMAGRARALHKPIGAERVTDEGYLERKVHEGLPLQSRWQAVHRIEWEQANGPVPAGHALKCLDGDKLNTVPANWVLIPRAILPRLNGGRTKTSVAFDGAEPELRPTILAVALLEHRAREARRA